MYFKRVEDGWQALGRDDSGNTPTLCPHCAHARSCERKSAVRFCFGFKPDMPKSCSHP